MAYKYDYDIKKGSAQLFKNPIFEFLSRTNPTITLFTYVPLIAILLYFGFKANIVASPIRAILIYLSGIVIWSLVEYLMHRFVFHFINENPTIQKMHQMVHGVHHEYPRDKERLFLPPIPGLTIAFILFMVMYGISSLFFGEGLYALFFFPGLVNGYLIYSFTHYSIHVFNPPKPFKYIWKHHSLHHYQFQDKAFGVSSPLWDYIFGTMPPRASRK